MSYIGKNPKVDSVKLEGSEAAASGTAEGQLYYNTGTGSISKGLKVFKNNQFVAIDKQLGDADTFHLLKAADISTAEWNAARNSTSTSFLNQNAVPFETTTASGAAGTFSNTSTGDALLTDESADLVFAYKSSGTSDDAQEYFGIPLTVPKAFRGGNIVLTFEYRTGFGTGTTATVDGDFEVAVLDKSTGNGGQTTTTATSGTAIAAGSNIAVASKTGLAVGQRVRLETGSSTIAAGSPDATVTEAFITSVSTSTDHITISKDYAPPSTSGGRITSGWLTDVVPGQLRAADSQTDKQGKKFSIQFKTEDDTSDIVLFFQNKNTSSTISRHLFVDNILLSANKFLQVNTNLKPESYTRGKGAGWWLSATGTAWSSGATYRIDFSGGTGALPNTAGPDSPDYTNSKYLDFTTKSNDFLGSANTVSAICAKKKVNLNVTIGNDANDDHTVRIYLSRGGATGVLVGITQQRAANDTSIEASANVVLEKDDYVFFYASSPSFDSGWMSLVATPIDSSVVVLESQDEIFTDWIVYTPTITGAANGANTQWRYRLVGSEMEIQALYYHTSAGTADWSFSLPEGFAISTTAGPTSTDHLLAGFYIIDQSNAGNHGGCLLYLPGGTAIFRGNDQLYNTSGTFNPLAPVAGTAGAGGTNVFWSLNAKVPIQGRNTKFNPLLSMPLVDFTTFENTYSAFIPEAGTSVTSQSQDFISSVTRPSTGVYTITFNSGHFSEVPAVSAIAIKDRGTGTGSAVEAFTQLKEVSASAVTVQVSNILNSGHGSTPENASIMIVAQRQGADYKQPPQPTAAVIKPAVAIITNRQAQNTSGGTVTGGTSAWHDLTLNTVLGESWFVTGSFDGQGGTNVEFSLAPGTYEFEIAAPIYNSGVNGFFGMGLYNQTDSKFVEGSVTGNNNNDASGSSGSYFKSYATITITQTTAFRQKMTAFIAGTVGFFPTSSMGSAPNGVFYNMVKVKKLK